MAARIGSANIDLLNGTLLGRIDFLPDFNIICGENGTLKTKFLQSLKDGRFNSIDGQPRILAISPKRNSERRALETVFNFMRQNNRSYDTFIGEAGGQQLNDRTYSNYPSIGELFIYLFEKKCRDGQSATDHMASVEVEFNQVIAAVFPEYKLIAEWDATQGRPQIQVSKRGTITVPLQELSLGEQEVLSLITYIYSSKDAYDTFLIDEPEVHLNWSLEEKLFYFFDCFCNKYDRQIVVVTHSRAAFLPAFLPKVNFFVWNDQNRVIPVKNINNEQRRRIAGEAIAMLSLGADRARTVFVEDSAHEKVISSLAAILDADIVITQCGNKSNVRALYKRSLADGGWESALFIEDGDNEGPPDFAGEKFIHLQKYCIENYLLDVDIISEEFDVSLDYSSKIICESIIQNKEKVLGKNKFLDFLIDQLKVDDLNAERISKFDASCILPSVASKLGMALDDYINRYISQAKKAGRLSHVMPVEIVDWIISSE